LDKSARRGSSGGQAGGMALASAPSDRTTVRRKADRAGYDAGLIRSIVDEALVCHVGFVHDGGPAVLPTTHARIGDTLYLHGAAANHMLRSLRDGTEACVTITLIDGLVLARSAFHHSVNYRSVVVFGPARAVEEKAEKLAALEALVERVSEGRWSEVRPPTDAELRQTLVIAVPLTEASAKVRTGPPIDDAEDYALPVWAGVVPVETRRLTPVADLRSS
jgi:nitroimidazol reductase NimA-like FMN-containing flavoprotein (pyridoxamine 5'-phosphate oxidase superfamily)